MSIYVEEIRIAYAKNGVSDEIRAELDKDNNVDIFYSNNESKNDLMQMLKRCENFPEFYSEDLHFEISDN